MTEKKEQELQQQTSQKITELAQDLEKCIKARNHADSQEDKKVAAIRELFIFLRKTTNRELMQKTVSDEKQWHTWVANVAQLENMYRNLGGKF